MIFTNGTMERQREVGIYQRAWRRLALLTAFIGLALGVYLIGDWLGAWQAAGIVAVGAICAYAFALYDAETAAQARAREHEEVVDAHV